jgi:hypothetical protein
MVTGNSFSMSSLSSANAGAGGGGSDEDRSGDAGCRVLMGRGEREWAECGEWKGEGLRGETSMICRCC